MADDEKKNEAPAGEETDAEHEVTHLDELTADVEVSKVNGSQRRLWFMVLVGVGVVAAGGIALFTSLEGSSEEGSSRVVVRQEEVEEIVRGDYVFVAKQGATGIESYKISDSTKLTSVIKTPVAGDLSLQVNKNGTVRGSQVDGDSITVYRGEEETSIAAPGLTSWVLISDGSYVYAIMNDDLMKFDAKTGEGALVAEDFGLHGSDVSRLFFARDGSVRQFAKTGTELTETIYKFGETEATTRTIELPRLDRIDSFSVNAMSPDGAALLITATINDNNTLQLISLNSFVMRTVYLSEIAGGYPDSWYWSNDSNNVTVAVNGTNTIRLVNLKVGTLEKMIILEQEASKGDITNPRWSSDKALMSYVQNETLKTIRLEDSEITEVFDEISADAYTGWYRN